MQDWTAGQLRYLIHFDDGGSGVRLRVAGAEQPAKLGFSSPASQRRGWAGRWLGGPGATASPTAAAPQGSRGADPIKRGDLDHE